MKLYDIRREGCFEIFARFNFQLQHAGSLFLSGFISDEMAKEINKEFPNRIFLADFS